MTPEDDWPSIIARITPNAPVDLDKALGVAGDVDAAAPPATQVTRPPSARLWARRDPKASYLGIRVRQPADNTAQLAAQLAAAAIERAVIPIILSYCERSGFERFGFRVERVLGESDEAEMAMETELARFWDLAIVIDLEDVANLG
ncbi:MAG: hypothetical protein AAFQ79_12545 [Pseudomonadota bacterium]